MKIGILGPKEAGAKAKARVAQWEAGKRKAKEAKEKGAAEVERAVEGLKERAGRAPEGETKAKTFRKKEPLKAPPAASPAKRQVAGAKKSKTPLSPELEELNKQLWAAAEEGKAGAVATLLKRGAYVSSRNFHNATALMWAAENGHMEVVKVLLDAGADVNAKDNHGKTAIDYASENGHEEIANVLRRQDTNDGFGVRDGKMVSITC